MRLNKFLSNCGVASRRKCDELIESGKITVNGKTVYTLGTEINEKKDVIIYEGNVLKLPGGHIYIKMNKPKGYLCSASDNRGRKLIYDLIKEKGVRLFSVGRLDYNTEGLIFLTNDGSFADMIMHPSFTIDKKYIVTVEGKVLESELAVMRNGVVLDDKTRMPKCRIEFKSYTNGVTRLEVTIDEGQNRQIRRMFEAVGRSIILLKRVQIGSVKLGGLTRGEYKDLTQEELSTFGTPRT